MVSKENKKVLSHRFIRTWPKFTLLCINRIMKDDHRRMIKMCKFDPSCLNIRKIHLSNKYKIPDKTRISIALVCLKWFFTAPSTIRPSDILFTPCSRVFWRKYQLRYTRTHSSFFNKQGIAETAKTNGPTCDNTCIQKI